MTITDTGIRIEIPLTDLKDRTVHEVKEGSLTLYETYLEYKMIGSYTDLDDDTQLPKEYTTNYRWARKRKDIVDIYMNWCNRELLWFVAIEFTGINGGAGWYYSDMKEAGKLYKQLKEYFITTP